MRFDVSVVIPVHNEEKILKKSVTAIRKQLESEKISYQIIIIENGSTDSTWKICRSLAGKRVVALRSEIADYGFAQKKGMLHASGRNIVNFDIDYYDIGFLKKAVRLLENNNLVIGSKSLQQSRDERSLVRRLISKGFNLILHLFLGLKVSETHGIKAWRNTPKFRRLVKRTVHGGNIFDTELILRAQAQDIRIAEIPVHVRELRKSTTSIYRRMFKTVFQLASLWYTLHIRER